MEGAWPRGGRCHHRRCWWRFRLSTERTSAVNLGGGNGDSEGGGDEVHNEASFGAEVELEGGGGHIWDLHPPIALPVMWGRKWAQFGVNLGNIWVSSPPPPPPPRATLRPPPIFRRCTKCCATSSCSTALWTDTAARVSGANYVGRVINERGVGGGDPIGPLGFDLWVLGGLT